MEPVPRGGRAFDLAHLGVFLVALGVPLFGWCFLTPGRLDENRERHAFPTVTDNRSALQDFPPRFEMYLGDHLGGRETLLAWHRRLVFGVMDEPVMANVWVGNDGWLFVKQSDPFRGNPKKPSVAERIDHWTEALSERQAWLKAQGIEYLVVVAPDKASVYPEHLRGYPARHPPLEPGPALARGLEARGVTCVNLLPALLAEKDRTPHALYFKTDSHWTPDGARAGYKAVAKIVAERFPAFRMQPDSAYSLDRVLGTGDLRKLAGTAENEPPESARGYKPLTPFQEHPTPAYIIDLPKAEHLDLRASKLSSATTSGGPTLLFLRDSFGEQFLPFLQSDFPSALVISSYGMPAEVVRLEKPRLVIQLLVARQLYTLTPHNPAALKPGSP